MVNDLESVTLGSALNDLRDSVFEYDRQLASATFYGLHNLPASRVFAQCDKLRYVCVPSGHVDYQFCEMPIQRKCDPPSEMF